VRELRNTIERALLIGREPEIQPSDLPSQLLANAPHHGGRLEEVERAHIERVVREAGGNLSRAARILDIDRTTLYSKLKRHSLKRLETRSASRQSTR
jgi:two-component system response regulator HydG